MQKNKNALDAKFYQLFGENLKKHRLRLGLSRSAAAELLQISPSTLQAWEEDSARLPNAWDIQRIMDVYKINVEDLYSGEVSAIKLSTLQDANGNYVDVDQFAFIPRYNVRAAAGHGAAISNENIMHHLAFRKYWIDNELCASAKDLVVISVAGDSMEGEIDNGDIILINTADKELNNGIYVVRIDGDLLVKRIQKLVGGIIKVISANDAYESFSIDTNNLPSDFECIGRVVWHGRNVP